MSESDGRCFPKRVGEAMDAFQWCGDTDEMVRVFKEAKEVKGSNGQPLLLWPGHFTVDLRDVRVL